MTSKEKMVYTQWAKDMDAEATARSEMFREMQKLFESHGGGKASCSLLDNFKYLMTSNDPHVRDTALQIYTRYYEADAKFDAYAKLGSALANVQ